MPSEDKEARGAQLQETLKAAGPVKGGPDQVWWPQCICILLLHTFAWECGSLSL